MTWTEDEIAAAFAAAVRREPDRDALTTRELAVAANRGEHWVRTRLRPLLAAGAWECVRVPKASMAGTMVLTLAYRPRGPRGQQ